MNNRTFVLVVESGKAADIAFGSVITLEGEKFVVTVDREYAWDTSSRWHNGDPIPLDAKIFQTAEAAAKFAKHWSGHPWWCKPNGKYEIFEVVPVYERVLTHWSPINE